MAKSKKTFDAVAWTRSIRDERYEEHRGKNVAEFVRELSERGTRSETWKRLTERHGSLKEETT